MSSHRLGRLAEEAAVWYLRLKGWRILERRFVTGRATQAGEVDIIAARAGVLAFVEVKARPSQDEAAHAIQPRQRERIVRGAEAYLARHPELADKDIRFDAVLISGTQVRHLPDAWRP